MAEARKTLDHGGMLEATSGKHPDQLAAGALPRAGRIVRSGEVSDTITLDYEARHRRRLRMTTDGGEPFLLDLPEAAHLRDGDRLVLDDGRLIEILAAAEPVADLRCGSPGLLARLAWHVGNRHAPAQVLDGALRIRRDHVLIEMARGLGVEVVEHDAPFEPERGAYHEH